MGFLLGAMVIVPMAAAGPAPAPAEPATPESVGELQETVRELRATVRELRDRVDQVERERLVGARDALRTAPEAGSWTDRIRLGGRASINWQTGEDQSPFDEGGFQIWDARFFLDAVLAQDLQLAGRPLIEHASFTFEWDYLRLGRVVDRPGEVYVDLRGLVGRDWLNVQAGRFQLPFGEGYLRFSRGVHRNPFISTTVGVPWWWDEGLRFHGAFRDGRLGYALAVSNGEAVLQGESDSDKAWTAKLWLRPLPGLLVAASGHRSGKLGSAAVPGQSALWLGESWVTPLGLLSPLASYDGGLAVPDGPNELQDVRAVGLDLVWSGLEGVRLWLTAGTVDAEADGDRRYDRDLRYWLAELVLDGRHLWAPLAPGYIALRANGYGTYDRDEGYLLDIRYGPTLGYNMRSLEAYSIAAGWPLGNLLTLRAEYTLQDIDLVRGVPASVRAASRRADYVGMELGVRF